MRTTLKRRIGRATAANGNGRAVFPPAPVAPVSFYRQPERRRSLWRILGRIFLWLVALAVLVALGFGGGAYLYYNQSVAAVVADSKEAKVVAKHLDIALPGQPTIALIVGSDKRRGGPEASETGNSDTLMLLRADPVSDSISLLSFPRDLRAEIVCRNRPQ